VSICREAIKEILGCQIATIIYYSISKWAIKRSQVLSKLSNIEIVKLLKIERFKQAYDGEIILPRGVKLNRIVVCLEGNISGRQPGSMVAEEAIKSGSILHQDMIK